ncbi:MAG: hypothetical protein COW61_03090 [Candidatus Yonathbacteria bacterium CG17_big_fil_post_rev_8_21_14_2_50_46_19]|nr:MAG: hypothetical protein COX54_00595 [Candidatus Yonathbacteria bacterium CG23_combo_of_CG06-09_8_20_14_all_46_18]PIQ31846.1 MAG: hypothetical protein COW61_03090 [Candidatus Yonathbacteria bacterium CG17_big_fil_post_rev_8_21_14_2_50_46_19]
MNLSVLIFFLHTTLATAIVGGIFAKKDGNVANFFGIGLLIEAVGFASWALAVMMPDNLATFVTIGAVLTLVSFIAFLRAATDDISPSLRNFILAAGSLFVLATFVAGRYIFPTPKFISEEGLLMFNLAPFVQLMYITILVLMAIPLVEKVARMFKAGYSTFVKFALGVQVVGAVVLITSADILSLLVAGWAIGLTYFALWTTLLFRKNIWS